MGGPPVRRGKVEQEWQPKFFGGVFQDQALGSPGRSRKTSDVSMSALTRQTEDAVAGCRVRERPWPLIY